MSNLQSLLQFLAATPASAKSLDQRQKEALLKLNELPERDGVTYYGPGTTEGNPQKQNVVEITAPPVPQEVVITDLKDRIKSNPAEFARENYNNLIPQMMTENESNRDRLMNLDKEANLTRSAQVSLLQKLQENQPSYVSPYKEAIDSGLKNVESVRPKSGNAYADLLTAFLPTILGSGLGFGGTAGARTAAQTTPMAIGLVREGMKQREGEAQKLRDDLVKKVNAYIGADKVARESFTGEQKALFDRVQASIKMLEGFDQRNENEKRQILQNARAVNQEANKTISGGIDKIAGLELKAEDQKIQKNKPQASSEYKDKNIASQMRKEFQSRQEIKDFTALTSAYDKISKTKPTPAGDISLIFSYMKMLDPTSVVREGEQATAANASGVPDRVRNLYNNMMRGTKLTPLQRSDFRNQAKIYYDDQLGKVNQLKNEYTKIATDYNIDPKLVVSAIARSDQPKIPKTKPYSQELEENQNEKISQERNRKLDFLKKKGYK